MICFPLPEIMTHTKHVLLGSLYIKDFVRHPHILGVMWAAFYGIWHSTPEEW